jgi:hypothetical protein
MIFICDVSIINQGTKEEGRLTPNPNVLIELGYAFKALGPHRIIMVMNTAFGTVEQLPFDLRLKRVLPYNAPPGESERAPEKKKLQGALEYCLRDILLAPLKKPEADVEEVEISVAGRWQGRKDRPGEKFGKRTGGQVTPATVRIKAGEVYKFSADWGLSDAGLNTVAHLSEYASFLSMSLFKCKYVTESGLCTLRAFRHLWDLDLAETHTTDKVLEALRHLTSLRHLNLTKCPVSPRAVEQIREALPQCNVVAP